MSVFFIIGHDLVELEKRAVRNINHLLDGGEMKIFKYFSKIAWTLKTTHMCNFSNMFFSSFREISQA